MSKSNGFLQLRRGLWEHLRDGRMSTTEALSFIYICSEADTRTGIWKGSAKSISGELGIPERTARDVLEKMEHGDYIRRFTVPGKHACYPILVHKFLITNGEHNGEHLNAIDSKGPADLTYFSREESVEDGVEHGVEHGAAQKRSENREKGKEKKNPAAKPAPPSDPRHQLFVRFAYDAFRMKYLQPPTWSAKHYKGLSLFLAQHSAVTQSEWEKRYRSFLGSTDSYYQQQRGSLLFFVGNFDKFIDGPILEKGKHHGKPDINEAVAITMRGAALNGRRPN